jgi:hypothetical protein
MIDESSCSEVIRSTSMSDGDICAELIGMLPLEVPVDNKS